MLGLAHYFCCELLGLLVSPAKGFCLGPDRPFSPWGRGSKAQACTGAVWAVWRSSTVPLEFGRPSGRSQDGSRMQNPGTTSVSGGVFSGGGGGRGPVVPELMFVFFLCLFCGLVGMAVPSRLVPQVLSGF